MKLWYSGAQVNRQIKELNQLIGDSRRILITSHISPDPDALSSALILGRALKLNFPDKAVKMVLEEKPDKDLSFLKGYDEVDFLSLAQTAKQFEPDLFIIVDASSYARVARTDSDELSSFIRDKKIKTAVIDHHEEAGKDDTDVFINNKRPATAEEVYVLLFEQLNLRKPDGFAEATLLGINSDTQRHKFDHPGYRETFRIISDLLDAGASVEKLENKLEHYNKNEMDVLSHLSANISSGPPGCTYSFISDEFTEKWQAASKPAADIKNGSEFFINQFIRNFDNNSWGFIVHPELVSGPGHYGISLRSLSGAMDVSTIAAKLGGGGHKPAAGAKITAKNVEEAIEQVHQAIAAT